MRGRDWPAIRQFTLFVENRVGRLHDVLRRLDRASVRVIAIHIVDSEECALLRLVFDAPDRGREILELAGLPHTECDLLGIALGAPETAIGPVCLALLSAEININYLYPLLTTVGGRFAIAMHVDNHEGAAALLSAQGFRVLTERDLSDDS